MKDVSIKRIEKILGRVKEDQKEFLRNNGAKEDLESMVSGATPDDLLKLNKILYSIALVKTPTGYGTAFLAKVPDVGICFLTAGHVLQGMLNDAPTNPTLSLLNEYKVWFANIDGNLPPGDVTNSELEKGKPFNLKKLLEKFDFCGSLRKGHEVKIFKKTSTGMETEYKIDNDTGDYAAFLLSHSNVKEELKQLGLNYLECATGSQMGFENNTVATIIGHPATQDWTEFPMRISYGKEIGEKDDSIQFDYDSLPGSSGSPVFGKHYRIKGIHVRAGNYAQKKSTISNNGLISQNNC